MARKTVAQVEAEMNAKLDAVLAAITNANATGAPAAQVTAPPAQEAKVAQVSPDPMLIYRDGNNTPRVAVLIENPFGRNEFVTFVGTDADGVMKRNKEGKLSGASRISPAAFLAAARNKEIISACERIVNG